jgi:hypothetical protein
MRHAAAFIVALLLLTVPAAQAGELQSVQGSYGLQFAPDWLISARPVSEDVCVLRVKYTFVLTGDLDGLMDIVATVSQKGACDAWDARANVHGKGSFEGRLGDEWGALDTSVVFQHDQYAATGQMVIQRATGDLRGLHGILYIAGIVGVGGSYYGDVQLAP